MGAAAASALGMSENLHGFTSPLAQCRPGRAVQRVQRQVGNARRGAQHRQAWEGGAVLDLQRAEGFLDAQLILYMYIYIYIFVIAGTSIATSLSGQFEKWDRNSDANQ